MSADEGRRWLAEQMQRSLDEQHLEWKDVAQRGGLSEQTLRRIRNNAGSTLTEAAKIRIEDGLGWARGDVDRVLAGGTYAYRRPMLDSRTATVDEVLKFMLDLEANRRPMFRQVLARIDAQWFTP